MSNLGELILVFVQDGTQGISLSPEERSWRPSTPNRSSELSRAGDESQVVGERPGGLRSSQEVDSTEDEKGVLGRSKGPGMSVLLTDKNWEGAFNIRPAFSEVVITWLRW